MNEKLIDKTVTEETVTEETVAEEILTEKTDSLQKPKVNKPIIKKGTGAVICIVLMIAMTAAAIMLFQNVIFKGAEAVTDGYNAAFISEKEAAYQALYQRYYDKAETEHHVANRAAINIGNIRETEKLEVLKVSDVEFIVEDSGDNAGNIISWLEVPGEGTYVVNLSAAEFIIDNERAHIRVRVPYPELTNVAIDYSNVKKILFVDDIFNGSYAQGQELARKQVGEGDLLIKKEFASNEHFYLNAQKAAISTIQCLIRELNPDIDDLTIDVEFY